MDVGGYNNVNDVNKTYLCKPHNIIVWHDLAFLIEKGV